VIDCGLSHPVKRQQSAVPQNNDRRSVQIFISAKVIFGYSRN